MHLKLSPEEVQLRADIREFVRVTLPAKVRIKVACGESLTKEEQVDWQKALQQRGWIAPTWPVEFGGTSWSAVKRCLFKNEMEIAGAPPTIPYGIDMIGPVLYTFGSQDQRQRFLPGILSSDDWWCQGFSEPDAGSDLASLRTTAVDRGDHYQISGQKIWTSKAQYADFMFLLARTARTERRQEGISMLLLDMRSTGVTVRPIHSIDGERTLNEVFLVDVEVPKSGLVGEEGKGWGYAKFLLGHERAAVAGVGRLWGRFQRLRVTLQEFSSEWPRLAHAEFLHQIAEIEADLIALTFLEVRANKAGLSGGTQNIAPSLLKIAGAELQQRLSALSIRILGPHGMVLDAGMGSDGSLAPPFGSGLVRQHLYSRAASIYGGTNEIQRDIAARVLLG